jgi:hypothetical protein
MCTPSRRRRRRRQRRNDDDDETLTHSLAQLQCRSHDVTHFLHRAKTSIRTTATQLTGHFITYSPAQLLITPHTHIRSLSLSLSTPHTRPVRPTGGEQTNQRGISISPGQNHTIQVQQTGALSGVWRVWRVWPLSLALDSSLGMVWRKRAVVRKRVCIRKFWGKAKLNSTAATTRSVHRCPRTRCVCVCVWPQTHIDMDIVT